MPEPESFPVITAGEYPPEVRQLCRAWAVHPEQLLGWSVSHVAVTLVLPSGHKVGVSVSGTWAMPERKAAVEDPVGDAEPETAEPKPAGRRKAK